MTGDGVNDAPAIKKADIGIAVDGATDAARAAADIVLTTPGLGVIVDAIVLSRCIFNRMKNYVIYRIACTFQLLVFFFCGVMFLHPDKVRWTHEPRAGPSSRRVLTKRCASRGVQATIDFGGGGGCLFLYVVDTRCTVCS